MAETKPPKVFISYAWEDNLKTWVLDFATRLRSDGVNAILDQWETVPGDQLPEFMEKSVRESDFVVFVCTPTYKRKSDRRKGGVGYEGHIITGEVFQKNNHRKFIPVLRKGKWSTAAPSWASSKLFIDFRGEPYSDVSYQHLLNTLFQRSPTAPPLREKTELPTGWEVESQPLKETIVEEKKSPEPKEEKPEAQTLGYSPQKAMEKDVRGSQEKRMFYDLTAHYECDFENTSAETLANFLFESLTRIMCTVTHVENSNGKRTVEYQTSQIEYLDPKNGKTIQHALIVHGRKVQVLDKGDYQYQGVKPLADVSEMLVITVTQGVNSSRLRFDSNELPNDAFKNLVEWILADIGKSVTVPLRDDVPEKVSLPKREKPETKTPKPPVEKIGVGGDVKDSVIVSGSGNVINIGEQKKPEPEKPLPKKTKPPRKPNTAIIVALIGLVGTIIAALLGSPIIEKWFSPAPTATELATVTATLTNRPATSSLTIEPSQTPTEKFTSTPIPLPTEITDAKGVLMVLVPAGEFTMGSGSGASDEQPVHQIYLDTFYMDVYEVTNAAYKLCVLDGACQVPPSSVYNNTNYANHPVVFVNWDMARIYCEWRGARLPTEAEWEKAARGTDGGTYPWGEGVNSTYANYGSSETTPVGSYPRGVSPYGSYDMAGNVWEWVADWYDANYFEVSPGTNPTGPRSGDNRVVRGGSWNLYGGSSLRSADRSRYYPTYTSDLSGFRCARDANP